MVIFHCYVSSPEGKLTTLSICIHVELSFNAVTDTYWTVYKKTDRCSFQSEESRNGRRSFHEPQLTYTTGIGVQQLSVCIPSGEMAMENPLFVEIFQKPFILHHINRGFPIFTFDYQRIKPFVGQTPNACVVNAWTCMIQPPNICSIALYHVLYPFKLTVHDSSW